ncbi:MAG: methylated-DNA--[protein]-cysteine S-methyltransferase [Rikenellaceae bacterium]|jgi:AraC family transcriptional regulator of adaptative response/methylated-DNA-[protein]-cysteine methyltransferase|nr:methylated-DNA--[protein]-cysteine S-methyltransferase [Rikenellaceae bacterium]
MKTQQETDSERIAAAIEFLVKNYRYQPALGEVANHVHLSPCHFQRMFHEWVGVTPKQFARYLSVEHAKKILRETRATLFDTVCEVGLSTSSRLHDLFIRIEGMTPGEYKHGGESLTINHSFAHTPFGTVAIASTEKGICHMTFADEGEAAALERLKSHFPHARYRPLLDRHQQTALSIFAKDWSRPDEIRLHLRGSDFQLNVWKTLLQVPVGGLTTYADLALKSGHEGAQRAVGTVLGNNPVVLLIPCHRVIRATGVIGNYRYGEERKNAIIGWEAAQRG